MWQLHNVVIETLRVLGLNFGMGYDIMKTVY